MAQVLGWLGALLGAAIALPQVWRILRTRTVAGLSLFTWQSLFLAGAGWMLHGWYLDRPEIILPNILLSLAAGLVLLRISQDRGIGVAATWGLPVAVVTAATAADHLLGPVVYASIMFVPACIGQVTQIRQIRASEDVSGVSLPTLLINLSSQFVWLGYAVPTGETAIIVVAIPLSVLQSAVVIALRRRTRELAARRGIASLR